MNKSKKYFLILFLLELLFAYAPAYAQTTPYNYAKAGVDKQISQYLCTPNLNTTGTTVASNTDLYTCINKLYKFSIIIAAVVGVFFIVIAGYVYMGSEGNAESVEKAKSILTSTITALVILFAGYILLKALNPDLIQFQSIQPANVTIATPPGSPGTGAPATINSNICQAPSGLSCSSPACNNYTSQINAAAQNISIPGVNAAALITSIMINESSCNPSAQSSANPPAYGLMQLQTATANQFASACGVSATIDSSWLTNPNNSAQVICIGAQYLQSLANQGCNGVLNIAGGYNGGVKACAPSADCTGTDCNGSSAMTAWECPYDDTAHTIPNTGYNESRNYAPKVLGCYQQNGGS